MSQKLGQHFLKDDSVLRKIADSLSIGAEDVVIEIGPGHGELTKHILKKKPRRLIIIKKDGKLAAELSKKLRNDNLRIIHGDARKLLPEAISEEKLPGVGYKIAGNIPYYITGYLLRIISGLERKPSLTALVI